MFYGDSRLRSNQLLSYARHKRTFARGFSKSYVSRAGGFQIKLSFYTEKNNILKFMFKIYDVSIQYIFFKLTSSLNRTYVECFKLDLRKSKLSSIWNRLALTLPRNHGFFSCVPAVRGMPQEPEDKPKVGKILMIFCHNRWIRSVEIWESFSKSCIFKSKNLQRLLRLNKVSKMP